MAELVKTVSPSEIVKNPENPRLIFREHELRELQESIAKQGILVPLTVFESKAKFVILDGERRWRCAIRLNLPRVPVIVQPEPSRMTNIMMMFAIHNTRREWDPLPTAKKLRELEILYTETEGRPPNEVELAQLASITRGEVRRLKNILALPQSYLDELMDEAEKPRQQQTLTVDHVLEATRGAQSLRKRGVIDDKAEAQLTSAIVEKYKSGVIRNTVEPRKLAKIARAVEREEISAVAAKRATERIITDERYSVSDAFRDSIERLDYEHTIEQQARRLAEKLQVELNANNDIGEKLAEALAELERLIVAMLRRQR